MKWIKFFCTKTEIV